MKARGRDYSGLQVHFHTASDALARTQTRDKLSETDEELNRSRRLLTEINCRIFQNSILVIIVIICELLILAGVL